MVNGGGGVIQKVPFPLIDVRDVAEAHVKALTLPEAAGKTMRVLKNNWKVGFCGLY